MVNRLLIVAACLATAAIATPTAQSDLDALMGRVLERRDANWKKLQQYTLNEQQNLQITALAVFRLYGFDREYLWFPRQGFFVRSPLKADGVNVSEDERRRAEDRWLRNSQSREKRIAERKAKGEPVDEADAAAGPGDLSGSVDDVVLQSFEPEFIQSANFLRFKFDQGQYALAGREKMLGRDVLKVEYYPKILFKDTHKDNPCERQGRKDRCDKEEEFEENLENSLNKTSLVTLWVDPKEQQILRYEFRNIDMDFLPGRWLVRVDSWRGTMQMAEPFPNVWLPGTINMRFRMTLAAGPFEGKYDIKYSNYRLPETSGRVVQ